MFNGLAALGLLAIVLSDISCSLGELFRPDCGSVSFQGWRHISDQTETSAGFPFQTESTGVSATRRRFICSITSPASS